VGESGPSRNPAGFEAGIARRGPSHTLFRLGAVPTTPCVLYAAKSTEDLRGSLGTQLEDCRRTVAEAGSGTVVSEYSDEAVSGFSRSRGAGLVAALAEVEALVGEHGAAELWMPHSDTAPRKSGLVAYALSPGWTLANLVSRREGLVTAPVLPSTPGHS